MEWELQDSREIRSKMYNMSMWQAILCFCLRNNQLFGYFWGRNTKTMDRIYKRAKFCNAQFQHLQATILQHHGLCSHFQSMEAELWVLFESWRVEQRLGGTKTEHERCWAQQFSAVAKAALTFWNEPAGEKSAVVDWQESKCWFPVMLVKFLSFKLIFA